MDFYCLNWTGSVIVHVSRIPLKVLAELHTLTSMLNSAEKKSNDNSSEHKVGYLMGERETERDKDQTHCCYRGKLIWLFERV